MSGIRNIVQVTLRFLLVSILFIAIFISSNCNNNSVVNENPEISDLVAPSSVQIDSTGAIFFSVKVSDPQGLENINRVFITIEFPNNSLSNDTLLMADDGQGSDSAAGDGIYSYVISGPELFSQNGIYIFYFSASDLDGNQSNIITKEITIVAMPQPYLYNLVCPDEIPIGFEDTLHLHVNVSDLQGLDNIADVFFTIEKPDGSLYPDTNFMSDNGLDCDSNEGDGIYWFCLTAPDTSEPTGDYIYHFSARDNEDNLSNAISNDVTVYNIPNPYVYNLSAPDSLEKGSPDTAYLSVSVWDPQGLSNIDKAYFTVTRPDGTSNNIGFEMFDRGDNGDSVALDGIYTLGILAPSLENQTGDYIFHFTAVDEDSNFANAINKIITAYDPPVSNFSSSWKTGNYNRLDDVISVKITENNLSFRKYDLLFSKKQFGIEW